MENPFIPKRVLSLRKSLVEKYFSFIDRRPTDVFLWHAALIIMIASGIFLLINTSVSHSSDIPARGGVLKEGITGSPRFVNPVLAITRADQDMSALIYSGLLKLSPSGDLVPDIAESVTVSDDALTYNIVLRKDVRFHDGEILNADDILFTISLIQDPTLKSPLRGNFDGVIVEKIDDFEINFVLEEAYAPFAENLTVGILPKHEWVNLTIDQIPFSQHNSRPIGAGPYEIKSLERNESGIIDGYTLTIANTYPDRPMIEDLHILFFPNEGSLAQALIAGEVDSATGLSDTLSSVREARPDLVSFESTLPRTFGVFFNQNKSAALRQKEVRQALNMVIDREELVETVLEGKAEPLSAPIPSAFIFADGESVVPDTSSSTDSIKEASELLENNGWKKNDEGIWSKKIDKAETPLTIDIATANLPFLGDTAEHLRARWELLGAQVSVRQFEQTDLTQTVIRTRDYEALLFGTAIGRSLDLYPFWHSSQRNDPGLNVGLYANITADAALTKARTSTSTEARNAALTEFLAEIKNDVPALFLFTPTLTTLMPENVRFEPIKKIASPPERYSNIENWHIATESVWPMFTE